MIAFGKRIQIEPLEKESIFKTTNKNLAEYGKVISIGSEVKKIKVGDTILFTIWGVDKITKEDKDYYFILESDEFILAVEEE